MEIVNVTVGVDVRRKVEPGEPQPTSPPRASQNSDTKPFYFILEPTDKSFTYAQIKATLMRTIGVKWKPTIEQQFPKKKIIVITFPHRIKVDTIQNLMQQHGMPNFFTIRTSNTKVNLKEINRFNSVKRKLQGNISPRLASASASTG